MIFIGTFALENFQLCTLFLGRYALNVGKRSLQIINWKSTRERIAVIHHSIVLLKAAASNSDRKLVWLSMRQSIPVCHTNYSCYIFRWNNISSVLTMQVNSNSPAISVEKGSKSKVTSPYIWKRTIPIDRTNVQYAICVSRRSKAWSIMKTVTWVTSRTNAAFVRSDSLQKEHAKHTIKRIRLRRRRIINVTCVWSFSPASLCWKCIWIFIWMIRNTFAKYDRHFDMFCSLTPFWYLFLNFSSAVRHSSAKPIWSYMKPSTPTPGTMYVRRVAKRSNGQMAWSAIYECTWVIDHTSECSNDGCLWSIDISGQ